VFPPNFAKISAILRNILDKTRVETGIDLISVSDPLIGDFLIDYREKDATEVPRGSSFDAGASIETKLSEKQ
jgi:hypothetical protein